MLVGIESLPTAENAVIQLHPGDNVAIARVTVPAGMEVRPGGGAVTAREAIPAGHKMALRPIARGEFVHRYGQVIGRALADIQPGERVHTHNLSFQELDLAYAFPEGETAAPERQAAPVFMGYAREDGRVGTRNYIAVVAASNCSAQVVEMVARSYENEPLPLNVDGVIAFPHGEGCGHAFGPDMDQLRRTLGGVLMHPNVSSAVVVGLGCEVNQIDFYMDSPAARADRLAGLTLQESGGTRGTVEAARRQIARFIERAAAERRSEMPASRITLGLNCGGSDSFSGITANPSLGHCSDLLAAIGGTPVLAETPEIVGAEHLLVRRARSRAVAEELLEQIRQYKEYLARFGGSFNDNPSPGNKEGGLTTILEKALGATAKSGASPLNEVAGYAGRVHGPGFVFMNTPGYDPASLAGLAAGGVNLIAFTTGRGSAIGFPTIPVLKIASNSGTFHRMRDNMDINAGRIAAGVATLDEVATEILDSLFRVASGEITCSERLGHHEFVPWRIGPVL